MRLEVVFSEIWKKWDSVYKWHILQMWCLHLVVTLHCTPLNIVFLSKVFFTTSIIFLNYSCIESPLYFIVFYFISSCFLPHQNTGTCRGLHAWTITRDLTLKQDKLRPVPSLLQWQSQNFVIERGCWCWGQITIFLAR